MTDTMWAALFDARVRSHSRLFFKLAVRILRDGGAAEDACQQAFLNAWKSRRKLQSPEAITAWLATAVVNESLQIVRRRRGDPALKGSIELEIRGSESSEIASSTDPAGDVDRRDSIVLALESLPESERTVVVLKLLHGLNGGITAEIVGCSEGEVSKRLTRAIDRLRLLLVDWKFEPKD